MTTDVDLVQDHATNIALRMLLGPQLHEGRNRTFTKAHKALIAATCRTLTSAAFGELPFRTILALPTGAGKTTCIAAVLFALDELGKIDEAPLLILSEQVAAGEDLLKLLVGGYGLRTQQEADGGSGISADRIRHIHADGFQPEDAAFAPIVIATHRRSRMSRDIGRLLVYQGKPRGVIVDEGLLASDCFGLSNARVGAVFDKIKRETTASLAGQAEQRRLTAQRLRVSLKSLEAEALLATPTAEEHRLVALGVWASEAQDTLDKAQGELERRHLRETSATERAETERAALGNLKRVIQPAAQSVSVKLPCRGFEVEWAVKFLQRSRTNDDARKLLEAGAYDASAFVMMSTGPAQTILQHRRVLPVAMDKGTVVLDAGGDIDALQNLDQALIRGEGLPWWPKVAGVPIPVSALKSWEDVELHWMQAPAGRSSLEDKRNLDALVDEAAAFISRHCAPGDEVLVCSYSTLKAKIEKRLAKRLEESLGAQVVIGGDRRPGEQLWVRLIHFGIHHSSNAYRDAKVVIALGDFPLSLDDAEAYQLGQRNTLASTGATKPERLSRSQLNRIVDSWCSTKLIQLAGRGRCRQVEDGKALPMKFAFVTDRRGTAETLHRQAMPGSTLHHWGPPALIKAAREAKHAGLAAENARKASDAPATRAAELIVSGLEKLRQKGQGQVSSRRLRQACGLPGPSSWLTKKVFNAALDRLSGIEWIEALKDTEGVLIIPRAFTLHPELPF